MLSKVSVNLTLKALKVEMALFLVPLCSSQRNIFGGSLGLYQSHVHTVTNFH